MSNVIEATAENFEDLVLHSPVPVLVDFQAAFCGPCRLLKPILAALADELGEKVRIVAVDVVAHERLAQTWGIAVLPTLVVIKNGREFQRLVGLKDMQFLREALGA